MVQVDHIILTITVRGGGVTTLHIVSLVVIMTVVIVVYVVELVIIHLVIVILRYFHLILG